MIGSSVRWQKLFNREELILSMQMPSCSYYVVLVSVAVATVAAVAVIINAVVTVICHHPSHLCYCYCYSCQ